MEPKDVLSQATEIARDARKDTERAELENTVTEFENSPHAVHRSLARTFRMLQRPFF